MKNKLLSIFAVLFLLQSLAFADVDKYFTSGCANNGDGSSGACAGAPAGAGAWSSCANAQIGLLALYPDLTSAGVGNVNLIMSSSGAAADPQCTLSTIVTDSTHLVRVKTVGADRPTIAPWIDASKPRFSCSNNGTACLQINLLYAEVDGIQAINTATGTGTYNAVADNTTAGLSLKITNSVMTTATCNTGGGGACTPFGFSPNVANTRLTMWNNLAFGTNISGSYELRAGLSNNGEILILYNNGAIGGDGSAYRFDGNGGSLTLIAANNWAQGTGKTLGSWFISGSFGTYTHNNNVTEDATSPDVGGRNKTIVFVNEAGNNFKLDPTDTAAKDQGADLSGTFTNDLAGNTRSGTWDVGPLEYQASGSNGSLTTLKVSGAL